MRKRWIALSAAGAMLGLAAITLGPDLVGMLRLEDYVAKSDKAYQADGPWPHRTDVCALCHVSVNGGYPNLNAEPAPYTTKELHDFASGKRANPNMRPLAMTLSETEIKDIADYFARQPVAANPYFHADTALAARGKALVAAQGCASCHGETLMGHDQFPRLAGQGYDYLAEQLDAFASGARTEDSGTMKRLAGAASPADRKVIAAYLASLTSANR
jgi:cytochrome c553